MENKNDTLQAIKDEYASERGCSNWQEYHMSRGSKHYIITLDIIATRYAAKENEGLRVDNKALREILIRLNEKLDNYWNNGKGAMLERIICNVQQQSKTLLSKTAHYDKNTDV